MISETRTVGLLWLNAAETWVDVEASSNQVSSSNSPSDNVNISFR